MKEKMNIIEPEHPKKLHEDLPADHTIIKEEATLSVDQRGQYFVRFPRKIAELLDLGKYSTVEFEIKVSLPNGKVDYSQLKFGLKNEEEKT